MSRASRVPRAITFDLSSLGHRPPLCLEPSACVDCRRPVVRVDASADVPCPDVDHYQTRGPRDAYRRVLIPNNNPSARGVDRSRSVVGERGHLESANAWTHLAAAVGFTAYMFARPGVVETHSLASQSLSHS